MAKTSTTLRLDEQFYEDLSVAMIRRKVPSLQSLVTDLLEQWLREGEEGDTKKVPLPGTDVPDNTVNNVPGESRTTLDTETVAKLDQIVAEIERFRAAVEQLRANSKRSGNAVQGKRTA